MAIAKNLERHDEIERMIEEGFAINEIRVTEIEDGHLISLVHLWRFKNVEEKRERPQFRPKAQQLAHTTIGLTQIAGNLFRTARFANHGYFFISLEKYSPLTDFVRKRSSQHLTNYNAAI